MYKFVIFLVSPSGDADLLVVHHDASAELHCYSPDTGQWRVLAPLPPGAGHEYAAITGESSDTLWRHYQDIIRSAVKSLPGGRSEQGWPEPEVSVLL